MAIFLAHRKDAVLARDLLRDALHQLGARALEVGNAESVMCRHQVRELIVRQPAPVGHRGPRVGDRHGRGREQRVRVLRARRARDAE